MKRYQDFLVILFTYILAFAIQILFTNIILTLIICGALAVILFFIGRKTNKSKMPEKEAYLKSEQTAIYSMIGCLVVSDAALYIHNDTFDSLAVFSMILICVLVKIQVDILQQRLKLSNGSNKNSYSTTGSIITALVLIGCKIFIAVNMFMRSTMLSAWLYTTLVTYGIDVSTSIVLAILLCILTKGVDYNRNKTIFATIIIPIVFIPCQHFLMLLGIVILTLFGR